MKNSTINNKKRPLAFLIVTLFFLFLAPCGGFEPAGPIPSGCYNTRHTLSEMHRILTGIEKVIKSR